MSTHSDFDIRLVDHTVCEIDTLKKGEISCANDMLKYRIETKNRLRAMDCLVELNDSSYDSIIKYLYEQVKELILKLTINI